MNSIRLKIFLQFWLQYISELQIKNTKICFAAPVSFEEGLRRTIVYDFVKNAQGYAVNKYYCSIASCLDNEIHAFIFGLKKSVFCFVKSIFIMLSFISFRVKKPFGRVIISISLSSSKDSHSLHFQGG